ncbi:cortical protein KAR9-domain-containing protein [Sphaerosporella brunnea]|uniref:Cortical protein KAR9-domain-containing protein n=1 Tax=Sphaerosporella brunnea TaxID=1250544 RepID=A0A5J5ECB6_9PEZI|nr:cortical protein KAR9-domain-containing protein [Sphaerosporella brunnea]
MLEADAEKRSYQHGRLSPSPSPHRRHRSPSRVSDTSAVSSAIEVPTSIPTGGGGRGPTTIVKDLPPTPVEDDERGGVCGGGAAGLVDAAVAVACGVIANQNEEGSNNFDTSVAFSLDIYSSGRGGGDGNSCGLHRRASVFSLSRISFSAQISRLTRLALPLSEELSDRIRNLASAAEMSEALMSAGAQIGRWIDTAKKVLTGLDAEDDVEWAAQGKESLAEVDTAVKKFSGLISVYVELIDELESREDVSELDSSVLMDLVGATESTVEGWRSVEELLMGVRDQVETALEWTELWTTILQDIQAELEACQTLVFELEEKRHRSMMGDSGSVDIDTLETIMEENPGMFPIANGQTATELEDSSLLGLFARMQPLRASLDFLPMRLQGFQGRAQDIFPTACDELESRRKTLERKWKKLNSDADSLKKELGEDRWVAIFRNAGKQATQMMDSIERSMGKLKESVIAWEESGGRAERDLQKKMENYEAKKMHYGSAIQRTFSIIGKGIKDRFTVNGEIIRLDASLRIRWKHLDDQMLDLDQTLRNLQLDTQALRDSISSLTSLDITSGRNTPGSSPASSVQLNSPSLHAQDRKRSPAPRRRPPSQIGTSPSHIPKRSSRAISNTSTPPHSPWGSATSSSGRFSAAGSYASSRTSISSIQPPSRPRWNTSTKTEPPPPATLNTPSPYRKVTPPGSARRNSSSLGSRIPMPSPLSQATTPPHPGQHLRPGSRTSINYAPTSPTPGARPGLRQQVSMTKLRAAYQNGERQNAQEGCATPASPRINVRPASSMSNGMNGRRSSMLPRAETPIKRMSLPYGAYPGSPQPPPKPRWRH